MRLFMNDKASVGTEVMRGGLRLLWQVVRVPLLSILTVLEPVVRGLFGVAMILGIVLSVIFEFSAVGPRFPFLGMLAASLACGVVLFLYYGIVALIVR